jgi:hypothetical protein
MDGSDNSIRALRHELFKFQIRVKSTVLNVLEIPPVVYIQSPKVVDSVIDELKKESKKFRKS